MCRNSPVVLAQVTKERGEQLAIEYGIKFMETSAKASINVEEAFFTLARDIKAKMEKKLVSGLCSSVADHGSCFLVKNKMSRNESESNPSFRFQTNSGLSFFET